MDPVIGSIKNLMPRRLKGGFEPFLDVIDGDSVIPDFDQDSPPPQSVRRATVPWMIRGRKYIIIDEWGPYDFKSPKIVVNKGPISDGFVGLDIYGPPGKWTIKSAKGMSTSQTSGNVPGKLIIEPDPSASEIELVLTYIGAEVTDYRGIVTPAGKPYDFKYSKFSVPIDWSVKWFAYDRATQDPRTTDAWKEIMAGAPLREKAVGELGYAWGGSPGEGVPGDGFLTLAEGTFEIKQGNYVLEVTSDDGVRVYLDDKMVFEDWTWHAPKTDEIPLRLGGKHKIKIEHFELDGYATLKARIKKGKE